MATARRKPTPPAKKPNRADERSEAHGVRAKAPARKRAVAGKAPPARKPARGAVEPRQRVPRSTKRSALPVPAAPRRNAPKPAAKRAHAQATRGAGVTGKRREGEAPIKPRGRVAGKSPRADSLDPRRHDGPSELLAPSGELRAVAQGAGEDHEAESSGRVMELHWGDEIPSSRRTEGVVQRWVKRGDALLRHLAEHGAARHEYRADLKDGRFLWVDPDGRVSAEAQARVLCSWSRTTSALAMAWADPLVRVAGIARVDGMPAERDDIDEEAAWRVAMEAADSAHAEYLYRVTTPHAWYFLALSSLTFHPEGLAGRASFRPSTPVGLVLRGLAEIRGARRVPRRAGRGGARPHRGPRAGAAARGRVRVPRHRLGRAPRAHRAPPRPPRRAAPSSELPQRRRRPRRAASGSTATETIDLSDALALLEDEWALFA